ncbi:formylglycine-generating enzyme family protein [Methylomonas sp. HYX-M1]|uniref:formylglycine-generating enzyme family protein n=1 Tax=Methylomonas sp. HYX-M1 TaxID=3139307 RepID=UPI00345C1C74
MKIERQHQRNGSPYPKGSVGFADLLCSLYAGPALSEPQQIAVAKLFKFTLDRSQPSPSGQPVVQPETPAMAGEASEPVAAIEEAPMPPTDQCHYFRLIRLEKTREAEDSEQAREWFTQIEGDVLQQGKSEVPACHKIKVVDPPLLPWSRLLPMLLKSLGGQVPGTRLDEGKLADWLATGRQAAKLPKKKRYTWQSKIWLLIDNNPNSVPFRRDYRALQQQLQDWSGSEGLDVQYVYQGRPGQVSVRYHGNRPIFAGWQMPERTTPLLILSDLGLHSDNRQAVLDWLAFGCRLRQHGIRPTVLLPVAGRLVDVRLLPFYRCIVWDRGSDLQPLQIPGSAAEQGDSADILEQLLALCYPAVRVAPGLLRAIRYLLPVATDVSYEVAVRRSSQVQANAGEDWYWQAEGKRAHLTAFLSQFERLTPEQKNRLIALIAAYHGQYCDEFYFEVVAELSRLSIPLHQDERNNEAIKERGERYLSRLVQACFEHPEHAGLNDWATRFGQRLAFSGDYALSRQQQAIYILSRLRDNATAQNEFAWPQGIDHELLQQLAPPAQNQLEISLLQRGGKLLLTTRPESKADFSEPYVVHRQTVLSKWQVLQLPDTGTPSALQTVDLAEVEHTLDLPTPVSGRRQPTVHPVTINNDVLHIEASAAQEIPSWMVGYGVKQGLVLMQTQSAQGKIFEWFWHPPVAAPRWDSDTEGRSYPGFWFYSARVDDRKGLGRDRFGLFEDIEVLGQKLRMRWIEPGQFLMGSPPGEAGRGNDEQQHEVTLSQGFWLADTACTQALWQAVMGGNTSRFKGKDRPVEGVSWNDVQTFLTRLNGLQPALQLCLPSEAQWEYACRAGTATAYSFGDAIRKEQVNFSGSNTVPVKSLPPNAWGLYQMHGNMWEWCRDGYAGYPPGPVTDPVGPEADFRVLRGGSWISDARDCRSACRGRDRAGSSSRDCGFRLSRGPTVGWSR